MTDDGLRVAPRGFTDEQWQEFQEQGLVRIENALSPDEIGHYLAAVDRVAAADPSYRPGRSLRKENAVELDPAIAELIDHDRHVGYVYDVFGEMLKLLRSDLRIRARGTERNAWHPDSPRALPYQVFSPELPLRMSVGYWLTDLPAPRMGNFVYVPGSHRSQHLEQYHTHDSAPGEEILCVQAGTLTIYNGNLWHRVEPNETDVERKNFFLSYCPSWVTAGDHYFSDDEWLATLTREQRIIMRSYRHPHGLTNPDAEDFPLFLDRETGADSDPNPQANVPLRIRKRTTAAEKRLAAAGRT